MLDSFKHHGIIDSIYDIQGTGHRVVHGERSQHQYMLRIKLNHK